MVLTIRFPALIFSLGLIMFCAGAVSGQGYPNKPVRILSNESGGGNDIAVRAITPGLAGRLGQPVIVENRPALLSVEISSKAQPDGYTLLFVANSMWLLPYMRDNVPWDPVNDFSPVTMAIVAPTVLVVHPALTVTSVRDLIALARAKPGGLNYSAGTRGSAVHLSAELFNVMAGVKIVGVAYKGTAPALVALMGGEVQVSFPTGNSVAPQLKSGKLRVVAVTTAQPSVLFPGVPTVAASGLPGYESVNLTGFFAPAKTSTAIIRRLNQDLVRTLNQADVQAYFFSSGAEVVGSSPEQTAATVKSEMARMGKVIKDAGIRAE